MPVKAEKGLQDIGFPWGYFRNGVHFGGRVLIVLEEKS